LPKQPGTGKDRSMPTHGKCAPTTFQSRGGSTSPPGAPSIIPVRPSKRSGPTPNVQGSGRAGIAARLTRVHSYPYPSFLSHSWESLVIQFIASASFGKSFTCISGLSGNVTTTIQLCPAFMGRASNLISAPDLAMGSQYAPKALKSRTPLLEAASARRLCVLPVGGALAARRAPFSLRRELRQPRTSAPVEGAPK
jgi:hypothetical protein